jgi:hypothetical protein
MPTFQFATFGSSRGGVGFGKIERFVDGMSEMA